MEKQSRSQHVSEHLANERTFLAWLRTAVALISFGIVIVKLRYLTPNAPTATGPVHASQLGLLLSLIGLILVPFSLWHYLNTQRAIDAEQYMASKTGIIAFAICLMVLGVGVVAYLLTSASTGLEIETNVMRK